MGVALRYLGNRETAEEIVNDSFLKILSNLDRFVFPLEKEMRLKSFKGWMARVTSRTALDHLRLPFHKLKSGDISLASEMQDTQDVFQDLYVKEIIALLYKLPEMQRIIFNLHEIEGFKHHEIARQLGIEKNVSRTYLSRARSKLRTLYLENIQIAAQYPCDQMAQI